MTKLNKALKELVLGRRISITAIFAERVKVQFIHN